MLDLTEIRWELFPAESGAIGAALDRATAHMDATGKPYALLMQKGSVAPHALEAGADRVRKQFQGAAVIDARPGDARPGYARPGDARPGDARPGDAPPGDAWRGNAPPRDARPGDAQPGYAPPGDAPPSRSEVLRRVVAGTPADRVAVLASTGFCGRELYALEDRPNQLYMVGSMGCVSTLALGLALARPDLRVVALDGDGAALMRMGAFATVGAYGPPNLAHLLLDNGAHDSTGGQATVAPLISFPGIAAACGYAAARDIEGLDDIAAWLAAPPLAGPRFARVPTRPGIPDDLPRPSSSPADVRARLMRHFHRSDVPRAGGGPVRS